MKVDLPDGAEAIIRIERHREGEVLLDVGNLGLDPARLAAVAVGSVAMMVAFRMVRIPVGGTGPMSPFSSISFATLAGKGLRQYLKSPFSPETCRQENSWSKFRSRVEDWQLNPTPRYYKNGRIE